jgi:hypothetical protein
MNQREELTTSWTSFVDLIFSNLLAPCWKVFQDRSGEQISPRENQYSLGIILLSHSTGEFFLHRAASLDSKKSETLLSEYPDLKRLHDNAAKVRHRIAHGGFVEEKSSWDGFERTTKKVSLISDTRGIDKSSTRADTFKNEGGFYENIKLCGFEEALKHLLYLSLLTDIVAPSSRGSSFDVWVPEDGSTESEFTPWTKSLLFWCGKIRTSHNENAKKNLEGFLNSKPYLAALAAASSNFTERREEPAAPAVTP